MNTVRSQLDRSILAIIGLVVAMLTLAFFLIEVAAFRRSIVDSIVPQTEILASTLRPYLFLRKDSHRAQEILASLSANRAVRGAYLIDAKGQPFAFYRPLRTFSEGAAPPFTADEIAPATLRAMLDAGVPLHRFSLQHLAVYVPIRQNDQIIGGLYTLTSLRPLYERLLLWCLLALVITAAAIAAGIAVSQRLQRRVGEPIAELAAAMEQVSSRHDLSLRMPIAYGNEIDVLAEGFNTMLATIAERDEQLAAANDELEIRVYDRTMALISSLEEKEVLLREIHHRVKNNLQVIASLLSLQMKKLADPAAIEALRTSLGRTRSISLIHEKLYAAGEQTLRTDPGEYLGALAREIFRLHSVPAERIRLDLDLESMSVDLDRLINLGIILNELLTNTFKHAFPGTRHGTVAIALRADHERLFLDVADNGVGLPPGFVRQQSSTLGLRLTDSLVQQAGGTLTIERLTPGTRVAIVLPLNLKEESRFTEKRPCSATAAS